MSQVLTLELSDEAYTALRQQAEFAGVSMAEWIANVVEQQCHLPKKYQTAQEQEIARQRFRHYAGAINLGYETGAGNESIDADLSKEYGNE